LVYTPSKFWTKGLNYTVTLENTAFDLGRNKLLKKHISFFYVGSDSNYPYILPATNNPYDQTKNPNFILYFSTPMDITSIQNSLTITPGFSYRTYLNQVIESGYPSLTVLHLDSLETLNTLNSYTLKISSSAKSTDGLPMQRDYIYNFAITSDIVKPQILSINYGDFDVATFNITNQNAFTYVPNSAGPDNLISKKNAIIFNFSEAMDKQSAESSFKINPSVTGQIYWNANSMVFYPETGYTQDILYKFYLDINTKDIIGNKLDSKTNEYNFSLLTQPPTVTTVTINPGILGKSKIVGDLSDIYLYNDTITGVGFQVIDLSTIFSGSIKTSIAFNNFTNIDPISLYSNVRITRVFGSGSGDPILSSFTINPPNKYEITYSNFECNETTPNYMFNIYKLEIKGGTDGIKDKDGNYMKKSVILYFQVDNRFL